MCRRDLEHHLLEHGPKPRPMPGLPKRASGSPRTAESAHNTPPTWRSRYFDPNPSGMTRLTQWFNPPPKPAVDPRISPPPTTLPPAPPNQAADSRCEICNRIMSAWRIPEHLKLECPGRPGSAVRLPFRLLPPGPWKIDQILEYFRTEAHRWLGARSVDVERIRKIERLNPTQCSTGAMGYQGYILFEFSWSSAVVLECPVEGNATYILWDPKVTGVRL